MTTSRREELARVESTGFATETIFAYVAMFLAARARELGAGGGVRWPLVQYQRDPEAFAHDVLGARPFEEQVEILEAIRDERRVSVRGGRKVGKDFVLAIAALWFYACLPGARVRFTAVKAEQVDDVFWRETRMMLAGAGRCLECKRADLAGPKPCEHSIVFPEEPGLLARTGLKSADFRELVGYTAREAEGAAGVSGGNQLYIVDEASAVDDPLIGAIEGNLLGCEIGRLVLLSNPTRTDGQFARSHNEERELWRTYHLDSMVIARKYGGRIPGIATMSEIEAVIEKYGPESDFVQIHVRGNFPTVESGRIFDVHSLERAIERWKATKPTGRLCLGIDVAGESGAGDESAFAPRRGMVCHAIETRRGLKAEAHVTEALRLIAQYPSDDPNEKPIVIVDRGGEPGARVWASFIAYRQVHWQDPPFILIGVDSSRKAHRDPKGYDKTRDELVANGAAWLRAGGAIPNDPKLASEMNAFRWAERKFDNEPNRLVDKKKMREQLGRSPDRADAVMLSCWPEKHWRPATTPALEELLEEQAPRDLQDANATWYEQDRRPPGPELDPPGGDPWWPSS